MKKWGCVLAGAALAALLLTGCTITISTDGKQTASAAQEVPAGTAPAAESQEPAQAAANSAPENGTATLQTAFQNVSIKVQAGSLHIKTGEEFSFLYADGSGVQYTIQDGTLFCEAAFTHKEGLLVLPKGAAYGSVSISVGAGHVYIEDTLQASQLALDLTGGEISALGLQISDRSQLQVNKGAAYLTGRLGSEVTAECVNGNLNLSLDDAASYYDYDISVKKGQISLAGQHYAGQTQKQIDNGAGRTMRLTCSMGAMEIGTR